MMAVTRVRTALPLPRPRTSRVPGPCVSPGSRRQRFLARATCWPRCRLVSHRLCSGGCRRAAARGGCSPQSANDAPRKSLGHPRWVRFARSFPPITWCATRGQPLSHHSRMRLAVPLIRTSHLGWRRPRRSPWCDGRPPRFPGRWSHPRREFSTGDVAFAGRSPDDRDDRPAAESPSPQVPLRPARCAGASLSNPEARW